MGFFSKLFEKKRNNKTSGNALITNEECLQLLRMKSFLNTLLEGSHYVSRKEYVSKVEAFDKTIEYFSILRKSGMLDSFCAQNGVAASDVLDVMSHYENITDLVDAANEKYIQARLISEKTYLDNVLKSVDPKVLLDDDQRRVILTDEDCCLVIAGAGAGKTTTVAAKVKYLVDKKNIDPSQILVVSFTNKAVKELSENFALEFH